MAEWLGLALSFMNEGMRQFLMSSMWLLWTASRTHSYDVPHMFCCIKIERKNKPAHDIYAFILGKLHVDADNMISGIVAHQ